jgi:hypothetical protein
VWISQRFTTIITAVLELKRARPVSAWKKPETGFLFSSSGFYGPGNIAAPTGSASWLFHSEYSAIAREGQDLISGLSVDPGQFVPQKQLAIIENPRSIPGTAVGEIPYRRCVEFLIDESGVSRYLSLLKQQGMLSGHLRCRAILCAQSL